MGEVKPYYQDELVTLYHGDCREVLPTLKLEACAAITDPPYNVGLDYGANTDDKRSDYSAWCRDWFLLLRQAAHVVGLTPGIVNVALWCDIQRPDWIIAWHKPAAMGRSPFGFCNWEPVLVYGKTRNRSGVDVVTAMILPDSALDGHPCPKPLLWAKGLIKTLAEPGDTIIDPFCGSGTTMRAAKDMGHYAVGIEIEERYCEIAARRLSQGSLAAMFQEAVNE